jgi:arylsulfatase A-like enzyme
VIDALLNLDLYGREAPLGGPFTLQPHRFVSLAVEYGIWAYAVLAAPFVLLALWEWRGGRVPAWLYWLQLPVTSLVLLFGAIDREVQRFLGGHASLSWLRTYAGALHATPDVVWDALREDRGGAWSSLRGIAAALAYVPLGLLLARIPLPRWLANRWVALPLAGVLFVYPTLRWNFFPGNRTPLERVRPALITLLREARRAAPIELDERKLARLSAAYQRGYLSEERPGRFTFPRPGYPLYKRYAQRGPEVTKKPNFIVLQLETFRAKEMASMNSAAPEPSATPFLDKLAAAPNSAAFRRHYASGIPTVFGFMALHSSVLMHPRISIPAEATSRNIPGFPGVLRKHGYRTLHFTASDPDWDGQRAWLLRWYDEIHYDVMRTQIDRRVFREAAERLKEVAKVDQPFFAYLVSVNNHVPFGTPEPELNITDGSTRRGALRNTMRYTDDVVRELYETLASEPWFADTVWIITGDHAFDIGDRGAALGHNNLRHETTWVPLIVHGGSDTRLPRGASACVSSHVDVAPTITELAGIYDDNSYMGHSLLERDCARARAVILRGGNYAYETAEYSLYKAPDAAPLIYAGDDLEQRTELRDPPAAFVAEAERWARTNEDALRYAVDRDRHTPR